MEKDSTFTRLIKLFGRETKKTPLEDFSTEILVGILKTDKKYLEFFLNKVLDLDANDGTVESQVHYIGKNGKRNIIDIVIYCDKRTIFIECKVDSPYDNNQLNRYRNLLDIMSINTTTETDLFYLTKSIYSRAKLKNIGVLPLRWHTIGAKFGQRFTNDNLIKEFNNFLIEKDMAVDPAFTPIDLASMANFQRNFNFCEQLFKACDSEFETIFDKSNATLSAQKFNKIKLGEYSNLIYDILNESGENNIYYGIRFEGYLVIQIFFANNNRHLNQFDHFANKINLKNKNWIYGKYDGGRYLKKHLPLADFCNDRDAINSMEKWFKQGFKELASFIYDQKTVLPWKDSIIENITNHIENENKLQQDNF